MRHSPFDMRCGEEGEEVSEDDLMPEQTSLCAYIRL